MTNTVFSLEQVAEAVRIGVAFMRRADGWCPPDDEVRRKTLQLAQAYEHRPIDTPTRVALTQELTGWWNRLRDERDEAKLGAVPIVGEKMWPIEDEV